jgi:hypothetical protein
MKLIVQPVSGLMNRFRTICSSAILAEYTNRELLVNWKPENCCNILLSDIVEDGFFKLGYDVNRYECYYHSGYEKLSEQPFIDSMIETKEEILYLLSGGNFKPNEMSLSEYNNKKSLFYNNIPFNSRIKNEANNFILKNGSYEGIHLRFTDRSQWAPSLDYIENIINSNDSKFYICSDNRDILNSIKLKFGDKILTYDVTNVDRNTKEGNIQSMIEWLILSNSSKIYYALGSSYSYEACIYNKLSNSIEMNPNNVQLDDLKIKLEF